MYLDVNLGMSRVSGVWFLYINNNNFCFNFLLVVFRLVNISSHLGGLSQLSEELQKKFSSPSLTEEGLVKLMDQFLQYVNMNSNCGSSTC